MFPFCYINRLTCFIVNKLYGVMPVIMEQKLILPVTKNSILQNKNVDISMITKFTINLLFSIGQFRNYLKVDHFYTVYFVSE